MFLKTQTSNWDWLKQEGTKYESKENVKRTEILILEQLIFQLFYCKSHIFSSLKEN